MQQTSIKELLLKHKVNIRHDKVNIHRDHGIVGIVSRFNKTLAERLFGHQYIGEIKLSSHKRSTKLMKRLPAVISASNGERAQLTVRWLEIKRCN